MVNILFVEDNFHYSKNLINKVMQENPEVRLFRIITNGKEALNILKDASSEIDIVLLDLKLPGNSGVDIIKDLEKNNYEKYKNSIIAISGEFTLLSQVMQSPYLYTYINKIVEFEQIIKIINELIEIKKSSKLSIEEKIKIELKKLKYNFSYIGTIYIYETILFLYSQSPNKKIKLEKQVYPILANKYNTTINNVKTNIINATNEMYYDCNVEILNKYLGIYYDEKPTPKEVISTIILNIRDNTL